MNVKPRIPDRSEFDMLNKEDKHDLLRELIGHYDDKEIRDYWGYSIGSWYQLLGRFSLNKKKLKEEGFAFGKAKVGDGDPPPQDRQTPDPEFSDEEVERFVRSQQRQFIDADFKVVEGTAVVPVAQAQDMTQKAAAIQSGTYMNFDVKGPPEAVQKRLVAIGNLLGLEEEDLVLKIEVYKA